MFKKFQRNRETLLWVIRWDERHTLNSWKVLLQSQANKRSRFIPTECCTKQYDRKYGWALDMFVYMHVCVCVLEYMCALHIYISFFCTHKQFETRIYAYLLFHVRSSNGWMHVKWRVWCKAYMKMLYTLALKKGRQNRKERNQARKQTTPEFVCENIEYKSHDMKWKKKSKIFDECENLLRVEYEIKQSLCTDLGRKSVWWIIQCCQSFTANSFSHSVSMCVCLYLYMTISDSVEVCCISCSIPRPFFSLEIAIANIIYIQSLYGFDKRNQRRRLRYLQQTMWEFIYARLQCISSRIGMGMEITSAFVVQCIFTPVNVNTYIKYTLLTIFSLMLLRPKKLQQQRHSISNQDTFLVFSPCSITWYWLTWSVCLVQNRQLATFFCSFKLFSLSC